MAQGHIKLAMIPLFPQWYVIHGLAVLAGLVRGLPVAWLFSPAALATPHEGWSLSLPGICAAWVVVLAVLYVPCRWFAGVKAQSRRLVVLPLIRLSSPRVEQMGNQ